MGAEEDARRRRIRWRALGVVWLGLALTTVLGGEVLESRAIDTFGTGAIDAALDARGRDLDATIMSSDAYERGWIISYEYFYDTTLEVGYQRLPQRQGQQLAYGSEVRIEAIASQMESLGFPASSRLLGTKREPQAWITTTLAATRVPRWVLSAVLALLGAWLLWRPPGRT